jgi:hypothetical protein
LWLEETFRFSREPWDSKLFKMDKPDMKADGDQREGWVTTGVAAKTINRSPRHVKRLINAGALEGRQERHGRQTRWVVSAESVQRLRDGLLATGKLEGGDASESEVIEAQPDLSQVYERLSRELAAASERFARAETRLELTDRAESSLRGELKQERELRLLAERRARELHKRRLDLERELQAERSKPWWRRWF